MEVDGESTDYMDENPMALMLKEERTHWEPTAIIEATTELKNWAWKRAAHPMEDFLEKIKTIEPLTLAKKLSLSQLSLSLLVLLFMLSLFVTVFL